MYLDSPRTFPCANTLNKRSNIVVIRADYSIYLRNLHYPPAGFRGIALQPNCCVETSLVPMLPPPWGYVRYRFRTQFTPAGYYKHTHRQKIPLANILRHPTLKLLWLPLIAAANHRTPQINCGKTSCVHLWSVPWCHNSWSDP